MDYKIRENPKILFFRENKYLCELRNQLKLNRIKGVFSKPSGNHIVDLIFCFLS